MSADAWDTKLEHSADYFGAETYWLAQPTLHDLYRFTASPVTGDWIGDRIDAVAARIGPPAVVSIGCGAAVSERDLLARGRVSHLTTVDPSAYSHERQTQMASEFPGQWDVILGTAEELHRSNPDLSAHVVLFNMSLHHSSDVHQSVKNAHDILSRSPNGGQLIANEYVGPPRFDFGTRDRSVLEAMFLTIPERFRHVCFSPHTLLEHFAFPDPAAVAAADPSEAPESDRIRPLIYSHFDVIEDIVLPGTFFQFGLNNLAGNFRPDDPDAIREINRLALWEQQQFRESSHFRLLVGSSIVRSA